ncbi:MAG: universal stress protein [Chloroflexi bacterium]|nr:universal stress protein [Chloroflexota bacterium]
MRKILIPLEISPISADILPVIRHLFQPTDVELTLLAVAQPRAEPAIVVDAHMMALPPSLYGDSDGPDEEWEGYRKTLKENLERAARELRAAGYTVYTVLLSGNTIDEIVNFAEKRPFDLLALATYGRTGLRRLVYGSVAEELLRLVSTPLLLMRPQNNAKFIAPIIETSPAPSLEEQPRRIVVATDGTPHTQQAVLLAHHLANALQIGLEVLVTVRARAGAAHGQQVMRTTQDLISHLQPTPELIPLVGPPDQVIGQRLEKSKAELLVIGTFQDSGHRAEIGITAQRVVRAAPMSVLVFKGQNLVIKRILACITVDTIVIDSALQLAKALGAELQFLHILPATANMTPTWLAPDDLSLNMVMAQDTRLSAFLREILATLDEINMPRAALQIWRGDPLKTILAATKRGRHDLILVGDRANAPLFPGSLADSVVKFATKSVLVVRQRLPQ